MSKLYTEWATLYDELYKQLFDYTAEYTYYSRLMNRFGCWSVLEYGCGTGRLATHLVQASYDYMGVDLSQEMIALARARNPGVCFTVGDLQSFTVNEPVDAALITGRTLSYLLTNQQLLAAFRAIHQNLKPGGLLVFDAIEAEPLFTKMAAEVPTTLQATTSQGVLRRESRNTPKLTTGWTWHWDTQYEISQNGKDFTFLGNDQTELRAFIHDEIKLFLTLSGFMLVETTPKPAYSWPSPYYVARRDS